MIKNTIKSALEKSNRYDDIIGILDEITKKNDASYPVNTFMDANGEARIRVDGNRVRNEAAELLKLINSDEFDENNIKFPNLMEYVRTQSDTLLHNYAIQISHRIEPDIDMDIIRCWVILDNILICLNSGYLLDDWAIPSGWGKIDE